MYSKRLLLSGVGAVKLVGSLKGCLFVLLEFLKKYLLYILVLCFRKEL